MSTFRTPNSLPVSTGQWYEEREAARFALYTWSEYEQLSAADRAGVVAHYRTYNKLQALIDQHQQQKSNLDMQKARAKAGSRKH